MAERIVILSDGTGNAASSVWRTNVWRIFQSLVLVGDTQAAKYDDGVGTSSFLPLALLGGAFGWGLKRNILDAYKFVCRNYQQGTRIYLFGFSRGAFTVRVLTAFILKQGLVQAESESELDDLAHKAYRAYRAGDYYSILRIEVLFRALRDALVHIADLFTGRKPYDPRKNVIVPNIEFLGVWDTVAAYGLPVDEMTRGVSNWIWPLELPDRILNARVLYARHALALDDERTTFHPVLWTEDPAEQNYQPLALDVASRTGDQRLVQVWFAGVHANVGGGYPDDAMAFVPLFWMLNEARGRGLMFKSEPECDPDTTKWIRAAQDKDGRLYNSRAGLGGYYRYGPRKVFDLCNDHAAGVHVMLPKIHDSVFGRIDSGSNAYAPIGLPEKYATVTGDGAILPPVLNAFETPAQAQARATAQERVWNYIWMRRVVYFLTLAASFHLAAFWLFHAPRTEHEYDSSIRLVSEIVRLAESFLPHSLHWWTDRYAANPEWFAGGVAAVFGLISLGARLEARIKDAMRIVWDSRGADDPVPRNAAHSAIYMLRNCAAYKWFIRFMRMQLLPAAFVLLFIWAGLTAASHLVFNVADSAGAFCKGSDSPVMVNLGIMQSATQSFDTGALCAPTGLAVRQGMKYEMLIEIDTPWIDGNIATTPVGYLSSSRPFWSQLALYSGVPLRRVLFRPWYRLIARVGETGVDEYFLDPVVQSSTGTTIYRATFAAERSGEVFLYVNDAVVGFFGISDAFYSNNRGSAKISIRLR